MDAIELMAGAMEAMRARLDVAAANLANASSNGFHRRLAGTTLGAHGLSTTTRVDDAQGPLRQTGRPFDLAITGRGGFAVREADGRTTVVRAASFERGPGGYLHDANGGMLLGSRGPLAVGPDARIDARGIVREGDKVGDNLRLQGDVELHDGFVEGSNVDAIHEMVDILAAQRAFETAQKTLGAIDEVRSKAASDVARVKA
ncbi:MAG: flagellar basal body rod C-terminal domain-containing protein [Candidatus Baltobacteraceae bacterium]